MHEKAERKSTEAPRMAAGDRSATTGQCLRDIRVLQLPTLVEDAVGAYLDLVHLEAPGLIQGLYLVGSVALDDFRPRTSDIDFEAVTGPEPDGSALRALARVHAE
ncbi:MAG: hypothetical protein AB7I50_22300, partial [Vicinamibacterales bacterium]